MPISSTDFVWLQIAQVDSKDTLCVPDDGSSRPARHGIDAAASWSPIAAIRPSLHRSSAILPESRIPALEADLEDGSKNASGGLRDVDHVGGKHVSVELELRDPRLQQHVTLAIGSSDDSLTHRHALEQLGNLELLVLAAPPGWRNSLESAKMRKSSISPSCGLICW